MAFAVIFLHYNFIFYIFVYFFRQLLQDCGIGVAENPATNELIINQHRALVFCQLKAMLDIIENDLFKKHMPFVTYLRLDGSVPPGQRHSVVTR